jgi:hypothetical protein
MYVQDVQIKNGSEERTVRRYLGSCVLSMYRRR